MPSVQHQFKQRHPKVNLPSQVKNIFMGKGNRQFRLMWADAIVYSAQGRKKVEAEDAKKAKRQPQQSAADKVAAAVEA